MRSSRRPAIPASKMPGARSDSISARPAGDSPRTRRWSSSPDLKPRPRRQRKPAWHRTALLPVEPAPPETLVRLRQSQVPYLRPLLDAKVWPANSNTCPRTCWSTNSGAAAGRSRRPDPASNSRDWSNGPDFGVSETPIRSGRERRTPSEASARRCRRPGARVGGRTGRATALDPPGSPWPHR
jgi:hypothetical protein